MNPKIKSLLDDFKPHDFGAHVKVFHELMANKVGEILLVSTPYDAFIMEEDGSLTSKIINEYRGLNLSSPPRLTKAATAKEALKLLEEKKFDLVITMPNLEDMETYDLVPKIKKLKPDLPVILLAHKNSDLIEDNDSCSVINNEFIWTGNADLFLALVKSVEDRLNVEADTKKAMVRVLILVEDSPLFRSIFLPLIYKVVVNQTLSLMEETLNEEHRLLKMRARPKILVAENYESAWNLFEKFKPYVFGVISDTRFPKDCKMTPDAGFILLSKIKKEIPHLPLLLLSSEPENRKKAEKIQAIFIDKNSPDLQSEIENFFLGFLGFGDFVFRLADKTEVGRAGNLRALEELLKKVPDEPVKYHAKRNHFSNWLMARSEITLASRFAKLKISDFDSIASMKEFTISIIHALRKYRQRGVVVQFVPGEFDPDISEFIKIGEGSLGGKARGLAFIARLLHENPHFYTKYPEADIAVPRTLVIATDCFDAFISENGLEANRFCNCSDDEIRNHFLESDLPRWLFDDLRAFLEKVKVPLSIRSSSLLEDAHFHSFAGLYKTFMIPNNHPDFYVRLHHLITAIKIIYASTFFSAPLAFSKKISQQFRKDKMAVIVQQLVGRQYGNYFYPAVSGVARSKNFYPIGKMKPEDGIASIGLGFGKILEEKEGALRFCPAYPSVLPQFSTVDDILTHAQRYFYALKTMNYSRQFDPEKESDLEKRDIADAYDEFPVKSLSSTYIPEEHRIRDTGFIPGPKLITFARILKYKALPLPEIISDLLELGKKGIGGPVEIEFALDLDEGEKDKNRLYFLQLRPMSAGENLKDVLIEEDEIKRAFCYSAHSMGHGKNTDMADIVYVKPSDFKKEKTKVIAMEIGEINEKLTKEKRPYLLAGPGRWGSSDRWLGIPVKWADISGTCAMIEMRDGRLNADPSQGSHFFQKITARGIHYITLNQGTQDFFKWDRIESLDPVSETRFLRHVRFEKPFVLKNDGRSSKCVIYET